MASSGREPWNSIEKKLRMASQMRPKNFAPVSQDTIRRTFERIRRNPARIRTNQTAQRRDAEAAETWDDVFLASHGCGPPATSSAWLSVANQSCTLVSRTESA